MSFPRRCRLKSPLTIRDLSGNPTGRQRWDAFRLAWRFAPDSDAGRLPRFAFVVSRFAGPRGSGLPQSGAVRRNLTKRRLREAVRRNRALWPRGVDIVLRANGDLAAKGTFAQLFETVGRALRKIETDAVTKRSIAKN
jgi:ribonuclease P protein component